MTTTSNRIAHASEADFDSLVLQSKAPVVVDFWAPWCPPCRALAPILEKFAAEFAGRLTIVKINRDENEGLAEKYVTEGIPTLLFFHNGEIVETQIGFGPYEPLKALFDKFVLSTTGSAPVAHDEAEAAFAAAFAAADSAHDEAVGPASETFMSAIAPFRTELEEATAAAKNALDAGSINQTEHDNWVASAREQVNAKIGPARETYDSVAAPALDALIASVTTAADTYARSIATKPAAGAVCRIGDPTCGAL